jgi:phospholipid/cholesterol/gamma-HCH transport system substrate-binding protein
VRGLTGSETARIANRIAALLAVALAAIALAAVLSRGGGGYQVTAEFENASQLVGGEEVVVGGLGVGLVDRIELGDANQALVTFTVEEDDYAPLPEGTTATIRSVSLASIAGRRVELTLPPDQGQDPIPDGGLIGRSHTVSEVDLDQVLNALDPKAIQDLKRVVEGLETSFDGAGREANRGFRYLNPLLSSARRTLSELGRDRGALERLLVDGSRVSGALAERAPEISELVANLNLAAGAIGRQRDALAGAVARLPGFLRASNTTFVNLRAALDDLDPLMLAARPVAERLGPFFTEFRGAARRGVPTIRDLDAIVRRRGAANDLVELTGTAVPLADAGVGEGRPECGSDPTAGFGAAADDDFSQGALGETTCALRNSVPILAHLRPYSPELVGWFDDFSTSGAIDANGGIARIAGTFNAFSLNATNGLPELLSPVDPADLYGTGGSGPIIDIGNNSRCPGSNERDPGDGSVPFTEGGALRCDAGQVPVGP